MTLQRGTTLGAYEITEPLGSGGMGEVYRARDSRLKREVAIKVLPEALASDPDRLARLQREAEVLASLNHAHIAQIHGLEQIDGTTALIMELVEGPTLADRLVHGAMPLEEALPAAKQIAEALEAAHERGVIHRDLKPANIKIRPDGTVKVLDFGLAKAVEPVAAVAGMSRSPTITTPAMTQAGVILGTAAYMSPEQARGAAADKRADVWAFGVVLHEMLAGRRLFDEGSVPDTLAAVLKGEVRLDSLPRDTPASVKGLIGRCLTRDVRRRLRDIGEARIAIEEAIANPRAALSSDSPSDATAARPRAWRRGLPWAFALIAAVIVVIDVWDPWRAAPPRGNVTRLIAEFGAEATPVMDVGTNVLLSSDGRLLAVVARPRAGDRSRLYIRSLEQLEATPLQGTEGARNPFFSPDNLWIGFFADGKLKKVSVNGGVPVTLCDAQDDRGGSWSEAGWITFSARSGESPLFSVSSDGGTPKPLTSLDGAEITHRWPQVLPGGDKVLFTAHAATGDYENANIVVQSVATGQRTIVHRGGYYARYLPTGHLVWVSQGRLFAAAFDIERLAIDGPSSAVLTDVASAPGTGGAQITFARDGTFAYIAGRSGQTAATLQWLNRDGTLQPMRSATTTYGSTVRFSPDGERLGLTIREGQFDIWLYEWKRDFLVRLSTTVQSRNADPVWTPDGRRITFRSSRSGVENIFWQRTDGTSEAQRLTESKVVQFPLSWHPNGRFLAYREFEKETGSDIWILPFDGDEASGWKPGQPKVFAGGRSEETAAAFSPDGRWLAYQSDESGRTEVYVSPFPGPGGRWQVTSTGGLSPRWSPKGNELFYGTPDLQIMAAPYTAQGDSFRADKPRLVSAGPVSGFDVHPDGQRLAVLTPEASPSSSSIGKLVFILNFSEELRRLGAGR